MLTDRRRFLQFLASAAAVAACPVIALPRGCTVEKTATHVKLTAIGSAVYFIGRDAIYELRPDGTSVCHGREVTIRPDFFVA